jgi:hypothetical protein
MKKNQSIYLMAFALVVFFSSCEKGIDLIEQDSVVYIPKSGTQEQVALLGSSELQLGVYHAGINQSNSSVNVTLGLDEAAGADFISKNAGYEILPSTYYMLPQTTVLIGKEEELGFYPIQLKNIDESFTAKKYILPISIKSVDKEVAVSETQKVSILQFLRFRNVYEAKYKAYGKTVLAGTTDTDKLKIDEVITSTSVDASTIKVKGAISGMNLLLSVANGQVQINGAPGSEAFNVANTSGKTSTYTGEFSEVYQSNTGTFMLYYTYTASGKQMEASVELKFWL